MGYDNNPYHQLTLWRSEEWWPPREEAECLAGIPCSGGLMEDDEDEAGPSSPRAPCRAPCSGAGRVPPSSGGGGGGGSAVAARKSEGDSPPWTNWGKGVEAGGW